MSEQRSQRISTLKNLGIFQVKLMIDAFRDILLSPLAIGCALIDLLSTKSAENSQLRKLMALGHLSDQWLNLFSYRQEPNGTEQQIAKASTPGNTKTLDEVVDKIEDVIREHIAKDSQNATTLKAMQLHLLEIHKKLVTAKKGDNTDEPK